MVSSGGRRPCWLPHYSPDGVAQCPWPPTWSVGAVVIGCRVAWWARGVVRCLIGVLPASSWSVGLTDLPQDQYLPCRASGLSPRQFLVPENSQVGRIRLGRGAGQSVESVARGWRAGHGGPYCTDVQYGIGCFVREHIRKALSATAPTPGARYDALEAKVLTYLSVNGLSA